MFMTLIALPVMIPQGVKGLGFVIQQVGKIVRQAKHKKAGGELPIPATIVRRYDVVIEPSIRAGLEQRLDKFVAKDSEFRHAHEQAELCMVSGTVKVCPKCQMIAWSDMINSGNCPYCP